jgi:hypothetical protein
VAQLSHNFIFFSTVGCPALSAVMAEGRNTEVQTVISDVVPMTTKITEHKLNNTNYLNWSKTVRVYLRSIDKDDHLVDDPPSDAAAKKAWLRDDARIFLQIRNSIDTEVIGLVNHCEFVIFYILAKEISLVYMMCVRSFIAHRSKTGLSLNILWILNGYTRS